MNPAGVSPKYKSVKDLDRLALLDSQPRRMVSLAIIGHLLSRWFVVTALAAGKPAGMNNAFRGAFGVMNSYPVSAAARFLVMTFGQRRSLSPTGVENVSRRWEVQASIESFRATPPLVQLSVEFLSSRAFFFSLCSVFFSSVLIR